jgi:hypothetical protein
MRFLFRWAFRGLLLFIVLVVSFLLLKNLLAQSLAENRIASRTGLDVRIGRADLGVMTPTLTLENVRLYNSADFGGSPAIDLPELHLEWDPGELLRRKLHFRLIRVHLEAVHVVESKAGKTNTAPLLDQLQDLASIDRLENRALGMEFAGIDTLNLTLGRIHQMSMAQPDRVTRIDLDLKNEIIQDIHRIDEVPDRVMEVLLRRGIAFTQESEPAPTAAEPDSPARAQGGSRTGRHLP